MQQQAQAFMAQKIAHLEGNLRRQYDLKKNYDTHFVSQASGSPEHLRDQTFTTINQQSQQQGIDTKRSMNPHDRYHAQQLMETYQYQAIRTGKALEENTHVVQKAFRNKVNKQAYEEMGFLQAGTTKDLYKQFEQKEDKGQEMPGYTAVHREPED